MKTFKRLVIGVSLLFSVSQIYAQQFICNKLPPLNSEDKAVEIIKDSEFYLIDTADVSQSDWIVSAQYLSCDGQHGFVILSARYNDYLYQGVPLTVWHQFKESRDKQNFHRQKLKDQFAFKIDRRE